MKFEPKMMLNFTPIFDRSLAPIQTDFLFTNYKFLNQIYLFCANSRDFLIVAISEWITKITKFTMRIHGS